MNIELQKTILLVEDYNSTSIIWKNILEKNGYRVITANTGHTAVKIAETTPTIDLILMDINPGNGIDGIQAAEQILEMHDLPLLFLVGQTENELCEKAEELRSYGYILKDTGESLLIASIKTAFRLFEDKTRNMLNENLLRESETEKSTILQTAMNGYWLVDNQGRFLDVNDAACNMIGYTKEEMLNLSILDIEAIETEKDTIQHIESVINKGFERFESKHRHKDGNIINVEVSTTWIPSQDRFFSFLLDISERKQAEKVLTAQLRLIEYASNHTVMGLLQKFLDEAEVLTGSEIGFYHFIEDDQKTLSLQTWSTNTLKNMCSAEGAGSHYQISQAGVWVDCVRECKPVVHNDYANLQHKKGLPKGHAPVIRELVVPVIRRGKIMAILGIGNKQTNYNEKDVKTIQQLADLAWETVIHKRADNELLESKKNLANAQKIAHIGSWEWDLVSNEVDWSDELFRIAGFKPGEGTPGFDLWTEMIHPSDIEQSKRFSEQTMQGNAEVTTKYRI